MQQNRGRDDRQSRSRRSENIVERIKRDVSSWFDLDGDKAESGRSSGYSRPGTGYDSADAGRRPSFETRYAEYWIVPGPHVGVGPKGYVRSSDSLKEQICERLADHGELDASELEVEVNEREVTLKGTVETREQKRLAERCAESVRGVEDVHNQLRLKRKSTHGSENPDHSYPPSGEEGRS